MAHPERPVRAAARNAHRSRRAGVRRGRQLHRRTQHPRVGVPLLPGGLRARPPADPGCAARPSRGRVGDHGRARPGDRRRAGRDRLRAVGPSDRPGAHDHRDRDPAADAPGPPPALDSVRRLHGRGRLGRRVRPGARCHDLPGGVEPQDRGSAARRLRAAGARRGVGGRTTATAAVRRGHGAAPRELVAAARPPRRAPDRRHGPRRGVPRPRHAARRLRRRAHRPDPVPAGGVPDPRDEAPVARVRLPHPVLLHRQRDEVRPRRAAGELGRGRAGAALRRAVPRGAGPARAGRVPGGCCRAVSAWRWACCSRPRSRCSS